MRKSAIHVRRSGGVRRDGTVMTIRILAIFALTAIMWLGGSLPAIIGLEAQQSIIGTMPWGHR